MRGGRTCTGENEEQLKERKAEREARDFLFYGKNSGMDAEPSRFSVFIVFFNFFIDHFLALC